MSTSEDNTVFAAAKLYKHSGDCFASIAPPAPPLGVTGFREQFHRARPPRRRRVRSSVPCGKVRPGAPGAEPDRGDLLYVIVDTMWNVRSPSGPESARHGPRKDDREQSRRRQGGETGHFFETRA